MINCKICQEVGFKKDSWFRIFNLKSFSSVREYNNDFKIKGNKNKKPKQNLNHDILCIHETVINDLVPGV